MNKPVWWSGVIEFQTKPEFRNCIQYIYNYMLKSQIFNKDLTEKYFFIATMKYEDFGINTESFQKLATKGSLLNEVEILEMKHKKQESINFISAYYYLNNFTPYEIDEELMKSVHKILMNGLIGKFNTPAGEFSKTQRYATFKGQTFYFVKPEEITALLDALMTQYVGCILYMAVNQFPLEEMINNIIKLATFVLSNILHVHCFSNGNGRLDRLIANKIINTVIPLPIPIFNFVHLLTEGNKLENLSLLVAESVLQAFECEKLFNS